MTRGRRWGWTWLGLVAALSTGCAIQKQVAVDFSETPRDYLPGDYENVYDRWTRHDYAAHDVDKALEVWATFLSWDFREAYIEKYGAIYNLSDAERNGIRQGQRDAYNTAYEFHVTAQSANWDWNDLDKKKTAWRVTLVDATGHELPSEPIELKKFPDAYERAFFPAKTPFTKTYSIRFIMPAPGGDFVGPKSGSLTLRIASPIGRVELVWKS
ncbi:MAG TPA: hypothetical protein VN853_07095 [Polyangia bacterium]|jgi:hypothetical protein|nr:hypothetical protein [Polyangia bacterium]